MWRLKWRKQWIEKHFTEKDKFGHCDMHLTYHEKDVFGDVVFEDYNRAMYLAKSMSEFTKIGHEVLPARTPRQSVSAFSATLMTN